MSSLFKKSSLSWWFFRWCAHAMAVFLKPYDYIPLTKNGWHEVCHILLLHLSHELNPASALCNSLSGVLFFLLTARFAAVMDPLQDLLHSTIHVSAMSTLLAPLRELCTIVLDKLHTDILKWCVTLFHLLRMIQSGWTCLWMFGFHWGTVVLAETDYCRPLDFRGEQWDSDQQIAIHSCLLVWSPVTV